MFEQGRSQRTNVFEPYTAVSANDLDTSIHASKCPFDELFRRHPPLEIRVFVIVRDRSGRFGPGSMNPNGYV